jgi:hypothetical protein
VARRARERTALYGTRTAPCSLTTDVDLMEACHDNCKFQQRFASLVWIQNGLCCSNEKRMHCIKLARSAACCAIDIFVHGGNR